MSFKEIWAKGVVRFKRGVAFRVKNGNQTPITTLEQGLAEIAKCGNCGCDDCPCPHYVLGALDEDPANKIYLWNDAGTFATGTEADFIAACDAAKLAAEGGK